jgi:small subunit ribosomal protein S16
MSPRSHLRRVFIANKLGELWLSKSASSAWEKSVRRTTESSSLTHVHKRDGRSIEEIGKYHPTENPSLIEVNSERAQYWLSVGAQPSEQVLVLLKLTGDWGKFKGDASAKSTVMTKDSKVAFEADTKKKSVIRPRVEKKVEEVVEAVAEAPAAPSDSADEVATDAVVDAPEVVEESADAPADVVESDEPAVRLLTNPPRKKQRLKSPLQKKLQLKSLQPKTHPPKTRPNNSDAGCRP